MSKSDSPWEKPVGGEDETRVLGSGPSGSAPSIGGMRLVRLLGSGGMGEVWLAHDPQLDRQVAVKTLRRELSHDPASKARFLREARAVARLNDPNIIQIHQVGEQDEALYLVMEFVDGEALSTRLSREGPLPLPVAVDIARQVARGLAHALANGVIHRDVKPGNILLDKSGRAKIADFGLAKLAEADSQMTTSGTTLGTPHYISPEAARGHAVDFRADIYSLGITFYHMLTGTPPFTAPTPGAVLVKQIQEPLPEPAELRELAGGAVMAVIRRMAAKDPADRFASYQELDAALQTLLPPDSPAVLIRPAGAGPTIGEIGGESAATGPKVQAGKSHDPTDDDPQEAARATYDLPVTRQPHRGARRSGTIVALGAAVLVVAGVGISLVERKQVAPAVQSATQTPVPVTPSPMPPQSPVTATAENAGAGESDTGRRLQRPRGTVPVADMREMVGERFDFESACERIDRALADANLQPRRREELQRMRDMVARFAELRAEVTKRAMKPGAKLMLVDPEHGRLTMTTADSTSFVFRDVRGEVVRKEWSDLRPSEVMEIVQQLMGPGEMTETVNELYDFMQGGGLANRQRRLVSPEQRVAAPPPATDSSQRAVTVPPPGPRVAAPPRRPLPEPTPAPVLPPR
ncbi:MAG: protein kinase [Candidatus Sumerlaeaceae bacterium]|nr:protein kinase [Candidatus Sumerlaeaceae bacterium]